ncbi:DUF2383 domain-containing protein [Ornithinibacillus xuwenensis]|uniref:DUF2383 domain-containing protein n=1 Tax=Ornithinibacillus xuwenensis TaxID=3144668 RepID=A0ABU9XHC1_9BACI
MSNDIIIEELNTLLRGIYMGIRSMEHYIQKTTDDHLKEHFQSIQLEIKENAQKLAEQIQDLGGIPADDEGFTGSIHSYMHNMMLPKDSDKILTDAIKGMENYGVEYSEELVKGDLDPESVRITKEIINTSRKHVNELKKLKKRL